MSDLSKNGQLTFDFGDFFEPDSVSTAKNAGQKAQDDLTPGLFDPDVSEEEEMESFLRKIHPFGSSSEGEENGGRHSGSETVLSVPPPAEKNGPSPDGKKPETLPCGPAGLTKKHLQRAVLAFLASRGPSGLAVEVPTRGDRCKAGAAAFWLESGKVVRTALVEIRTGPDALVQTAGHEEQFRQLKLARMEREMLEQEIRRTEPELRDGAMLFSEFEHWNYDAAANPAYQECLRRIRQLEHSIFHGSRLERFQNSLAASELYLAVPERAVAPETLAEGWGLIYVRPDLSCELVKPPERLENVPEENLVRLALKIAASDLPAALFAHGIVPGPDGVFRCGRLPRRRLRKN